MNARTQASQHHHGTREHRAFDDDVHEEGLQDDLEKIRNVLEDEGHPMPKNAIHRQIGGNRQRIIGSINVWVERGLLTKTTEGRSQLIGLPG